MNIQANSELRLDKLVLNMIVVFEALYQDRSVTRAAEQLHLTRPATSNALARLRHSLTTRYLCAHQLVCCPRRWPKILSKTHWRH